MAARIFLMIETTFNTQSAKAAIYAVDEYFERTKKERLPVMISATIVDNSGRTLSGQTIKTSFISFKHQLRPGRGADEEVLQADEGGGGLAHRHGPDALAAYASPDLRLSRKGHAG